MATRADLESFIAAMESQLAWHAKHLEEPATRADHYAEMAIIRSRIQINRNRLDHLKKMEVEQEEIS